MKRIFKSIFGNVDVEICVIHEANFQIYFLVQLDIECRCMIFGFFFSFSSVIYQHLHVIYKHKSVIHNMHSIYTKLN